MHGHTTRADSDYLDGTAQRPQSEEVERECGQTDVTADLPWEEAIAHHRLVAVAAAHHAHAGLERIARGEEAPDIPQHLQSTVRWGAGPAGDAIGAWTLRPTGRPDPALEGGAAWTWAGSPETVRKRVMTQHVDGVEHRRNSWSAWDPDEPRPPADQARIILAPLGQETEDQRAVTVDVRSGIHLDGTLRAATAKIVWTGPKYSGEYPSPTLFTEPEAPRATEALRRLGEEQEGITAAARWLTALYRLEDMRPTRRP